MTSNDIPQRLRLAIKTKLTTLDAFIDDELPDFIMVMVARKKSEEEMVSELEPFLEENAKSFTSWVTKLFEKLNGMAKSGTISQNTQLQTIRKRRVSSSPSKSRSRSRSNSSRSSSRSSGSSSRSRSRSRSRNRSRRVKKSDAYDGPGGRRKGLDLARTYRNSSSEDSYSKGYHNDRKKRDRRLARRREGRHSRSSSSSSSRSRYRRKRSKSHSRRRSRSRRHQKDHKKNNKDSRFSISPEKNKEEIYKEKRAASIERKIKIAEENVRERMLADGDDGFGWSEGRQAQQPPPEDPASITQRLIDEELAKIEKEKAELDAEKTRLLGEKRLELTRKQEKSDRSQRNGQRRSRSRDRRRSRSRNRRSRSRNSRSRSRDARRSRERHRRKRSISIPKEPRSPISSFPLRKQRARRLSSDEDVDGIPMDRPGEPKKIMDWSPNRGTMIRPPDNYEKSTSSNGGKWPQWADNENFKYDEGGPKEPKSGWPDLPKNPEELPW